MVLNCNRLTKKIVFKITVNYVRLNSVPTYFIGIK